MLLIGLEPIGTYPQFHLFAQVEFLHRQDITEKLRSVRNRRPVDNSKKLGENQDLLATHPHQSSRLDWR